jgi:hypothetical protein
MHRKLALETEGVTCKPIAVGGSVETESGEVRQLSKSAAASIAKLVGRRASGCFRPLDGAEATAILDAIDAGSSVGDVFVVRLKGRKSEIMFSVEGDGLVFQVGKMAVAA